MVKEIRQQRIQTEAPAQETETATQQTYQMAILQFEGRVQEAQAKAQQAEIEAMLAKAKAQEAQQRALKAEARAQFVETVARQAKDQAAVAEASLQKVINSRSWRVTKPIRKLAVTMRTWRKNNVLHKILKGFGLVSSMSTPISESMTTPQELIELSPCAREIYFQLKDAIEKNQENK